MQLLDPKVPSLIRIKLWMTIWEAVQKALGINFRPSTILSLNEEQLLDYTAMSLEVYDVTGNPEAISTIKRLQRRFDAQVSQ